MFVSSAESAPVAAAFEESIVAVIVPSGFSMITSKLRVAAEAETFVPPIEVRPLAASERFTVADSEVPWATEVGNEELEIVLPIMLVWGNVTVVVPV